MESSCSTFRPEKPSVRGGVQVLPPVVPPRAPAKPKPPVPPKRDELTRLTTVKKDPIPILRPAPPDHPPPPIPVADEVAKPLEVLERKILERIENRCLSDELDLINLRRGSIEKKPDEPKTFSETIEHFERQGSFGKSNGKSGKPLVRSNSEIKPLARNVDYENSAQFECNEVLYASINPETKKQQLVKDIPPSDSKSNLSKLSSPVMKDAPPTTLNRLNEEKEESSEDEGATADIWVRAIESPVKKPDNLHIRSNSTSEEPTEEKVRLPHRASIDNSQLRTPPKLDKPEIIIENKEPDMVPEPPVDKRLSKLGTESLPCSRPSSRATSRSSSPAAFGTGHDKDKKKMSAAEALGVVAKPCPRPPPGKRKNQLEFRRQSLGNLSDTKLSMGCSTSCPSHQLWSSFGECHEPEHRRHERARGQSADSRTLQRLKSDNWETQSYSSTLSRIGKYSTSKYFNKEEQSRDCGRHPQEVGKRTFSVEELPFVRGSATTGSTRSSFGKSPRVTFALSEDEMGASGGATPKYHGRARSYDADDRYHQQSNRSQPAIGLKQTPKARMDDADIQAAVESILGKGAKVVDCEKKSTIREEEVLLVNGRPVRLEAGEGQAIREAVARGASPGTDLLNQILVRAGVLAAPVRLETSLSVRSSVLSREQLTVSRGGAVVDGRSRETAEEHSYSSTTAELWEPALSSTLSTSSLLTSLTRPFSSTSSSTASTTASEDSTGSDLGISDLSINSSSVSTSFSSTNPSTLSIPTIFGTVASDQTPKDSSTCRRSLPQTTPAGVANGSDLPPSQADSNPSQDNAVVYREGNLVSGRLEALVQHMVPTLEYYPDRAFLFAFLLTSRLFIKPHDLLGQILALTESQLKAKQATPKERSMLLPRLVQLIGEWSETFPYDFRDERVMSHVREVAVSVDGAARQEVSLLLHNLLYRLKKLEQYEAFLHSIHTEATTNSIESLSQTDVSELCGSAVSLAQQLTHIELERLSYIGPEEFVQAFAKESPALETSFKDMKQTRNLESYVSWFNRLSYFVATEVCKHLKSKKQRVRVVEFWVETARECFNIGNFNSLMAIIAGLNMSPISRLKRTWSKVQCAKFSVLEHQMDPSCNFSSYRSTLKAAVWRSAAATDDTQRIVIPFFSLLVKDLYFLNEGCSNKLPNGHINFEKFWQLAKQVTEFITWKQVHCPFPKSPKVITYLQATPVLNEDALALASFECEPPENHEKERYKSLKSDSSSS